MKLLPYVKCIYFALLGVFIISCSDDEEMQLDPWQIEVEQVKLATEQFVDFDVATQTGLIDVSGYVPNMGYHYLNPAHADGVFEFEKPEIILYVPNEQNVMEMVAVEYSIIPEDPENPGSPPEGFTGSEDLWHFNENVGQWQLHVWTKLGNPDGIFHPTNSAIGD